MSRCQAAVFAISSVLWFACESASPVPVRSEVSCGNGIDEDGDGLTDCADPECEGRACPGDVCTQGRTCSSGSCQDGVARECLSPPGACYATPGTCSLENGGCVFVVTTGAPCDGGTCQSDGECRDVTVETACANGIDDDQNGLTDCADPDCEAQSCDLNACRAGAICAAGECTAGVAIPCNTPPATGCFVTAGTCVPGDGGCSYTTRPAGSSCPGGECRADGGCASSESGDLCANGVDDDQDGLTDCEDPSCAAHECDDLNVCTVGDLCAALSCGSGASVSCVAPTECMEPPPECDSSLGCVYMPKPEGLGCDGGFCDSTGICAPPFPYTPSNFNPLMFPPSARGGSVVLNCGVSTFDSTTLTFGNWCGQTPPTPQVVLQQGGLEAAIIPFEDLTVSANAELRLTGSRAVIFAVYGDVVISGRVVASADLAASGPGAVPCPYPTGGVDTALRPDGGIIVASGGSGGSFASNGSCGFNGLGPPGWGGQPASCAPGAVAGAFTLSPLRGGCPGGIGGGGLPDGGVVPAAIAGGAGGAVQLSAASTLTVHGTVDAVGGGGGGAPVLLAGGGGGGAGGGVLLEGDDVFIASTAILSTTGGGGGEASGYDAGAPGLPGQNGRHDMPFAALGGWSGDCPGQGGANGAFPGGTYLFPSSPSCTSAASYGGGGGGGGGLGYIRLNAKTGCVLSPVAGFWGEVSGNSASCSP